MFLVLDEMRLLPPFRSDGQLSSIAYGAGICGLLERS